ncbi:hypothetical protein L1987_18334 [Smallanthus sonchifolius]|uniref:Uncharacterized protein n=1 Tax=Smallanthus sonchifolius TaxID=185202 RepID=A0ACB9J0G8_9ASTR|nr:hypothetical protein L1987_18334 [Smallanthus sonchifolius]
MSSLQQLPCAQLGLCTNGRVKKGVPFLFRAERISTSYSTTLQDKVGRRQMLATGVTIAPWLLLPYQLFRSSYTPVIHLDPSDLKTSPFLQPIAPNSCHWCNNCSLVTFVIPKVNCVFCRKLEGIFTSHG